MTAGDAQPLDPRLQFAVRVQLFHALIAGAAYVRSFKHHQRHAVVDAGNLDPIDQIADLASGKQSRRDGAGSVEEIDRDRG